MRTRWQSAALWAALLCAQPGQAACTLADQLLSALTTAELSDFVAEHFQRSDYDCALRAVALKAKSLAGVADPGAAHERMVLRNLAVRTAAEKEWQIDKRLAMVRAASTTLLPLPGAPLSAELKLDTLLALKASAKFREEGQFGVGLKALTLALESDAKQVPAASQLRSAEMYYVLLGGTSLRYVEDLAEFAKATRGLTSADQARRSMARSLAGGLFTGDARADVAMTLRRCRALMDMTEALEDVQIDPSYLPVGWQWRPLAQAARCYRDVARLTESRALLGESLLYVRKLQPVDVRLGNMRFLLSDLMTMDYDRTEVQKLANEMMATAQVTDSAMAREVLQAVPTSMQKWSKQR